MTSSMPASQPASTAITRRRFAAGSAAVASLVTDAVTRTAHAAGSDRLKVGLVGCGGRGLGAAVQAMAADAGNVLWALADAFPDRLEQGANTIARTVADKAQADATFAARFDCPPERRFSGLDGYKRVIEACDVVLLAAPTAFRPAHLRAAIDAGRHVFCEKPVAVDATALRLVRDSLQTARDRKLNVVSGFCWRYSSRMRDVFRRIAAGAIGPVRSAITTYNVLGYRGEVPRKPGWTDMEYRLRNWQYYTWLSGDHITEQAIHSLDRMLWAFGDQLPVSVLCTGGRQLRGPAPEGNNIYDHFTAIFQFADGRRGVHMCRQFPNAANDNSDYITGTTGTAEINGFQHVQRLLTGAGTWNSDVPKNEPYQQEHDELFASIRAGGQIDDGNILVNSNLLTLMARASAYTGQVITVEQLWASRENLVPDPLALDMPPPASPIAEPGTTKFV